jgi:preprotein translocase subunit SecA
MFEGILKKIFGDKSQKDLTELSPVVDATNEAYIPLKNLTDDQLRDKTADFKLIIKKSCVKLVEKKRRTKKSRSIYRDNHF